MIQNKVGNPIFGLARGEGCAWCTAHTAPCCTSSTFLNPCQGLPKVDFARENLSPKYRIGKKRGARIFFPSFKGYS